MGADLLADTIIMKDGRRTKGLVVEEYMDRVTLSTVDGEKNILKKDVERIEYDTPEQNFMQLGRAYDARERYDKAASYYKKAMDINPDYKEAREAYLASHSKIWRQEERMTKKELERQSLVMDWRKNRNKKVSSPSKDKALLLKDSLGISLVDKDGIFTIAEVMPYSSAARAGIEEGDILAGIWGKLVSYSDAEQVIDELLGPKYSEIRVLVEKGISIPVDGSAKGLYKKLGILLSFEYEGLVVEDIVAGGKGEAAGFKKGDFVIAVDKNITRYLPLDNVIALINSARDEEDLIFTIRRIINLRREGK
ncbi:PDZ domain-containing protein [Candidatus Omnitrophota bacterium]